MRRLNQALCILCLMLCFGSSWVYETTSVSVQFVIGQVEYSTKSDPSKKRLGLSTSLFAGDRVFTKLESRVELKMFDGSIIKVGENSLFTIEEMKKEDESSSMSFGLSFGNVWAKFKKIFSSSSSRDISTPTAVVAVRGTEFGVEVDPATGKTKVKVKEGRVEVTNRRGTNAQSVSANEQTEVDENGNTEAPTPYQHDTNNEMNSDGSPDTPNNGNGQGTSSDSTSTNNRTSSSDRQSSNTEPDRIKPRIKLKRNVQGRFTNLRTYVVTGSVMDQTPNDEIYVFVNGESVTKIQKQGGFRHNINLIEGVNQVTVTAQDKAGNVATVAEELFLDSNKPRVQITSGVHPISLGLSNSELPPRHPKFKSFKRSIRGYLIDSEPSSGIKRVLVNGQEVRLRSDNSFEINFRIPLNEIEELKRANRPYIIKVEAEDLAGNVFRDQSIRIKIR